MKPQRSLCHSAFAMVTFSDLFINNKISTDCNSMTEDLKTAISTTTAGCNNAAAGGSEANSAENGQQTTSLKHVPSAQMWCYQPPEGRAGYVCWVWGVSENAFMALLDGNFLCGGKLSTNVFVCLCSLWGCSDEYIQRVTYCQWLKSIFWVSNLYVQLLYY